MTSNDHNKLLAIWLLEVLALFALILTMTSCYNSRKAESQTQKALIKYPATVAKIARTAFPCIELKRDSSGYFNAIAQRDSVAAKADSLGSWIAYLRGKLDGLLLDSLTAVNCGELLSQVEAYAKDVEEKNAQLSKQIKSIKPGIVEITKEDSSKIWEAQRLQRSAEDTSARYSTLYQKEKSEHDALKAKAIGKVVIYIPILLIILLALGGIYAIVSKIRNSFNPLKWFT